jgi:hypothetical protein
MINTSQKQSMLSDIKEQITYLHKLQREITDFARQMYKLCIKDTVDGQNAFEQYNQAKSDLRKVHKMISTKASIAKGLKSDIRRKIVNNTILH